MPVNYTTFEDARLLSGIKLQVIKGIPSPWTEAAKAILHVIKIPYVAVAFDAFNSAQTTWFETASAPSLKRDKHAALIDWLDILHFVEAQSNAETENKTEAISSLLPKDLKDKEEHLALCHSICSKKGLGWQRRLQSVHQGLQNEGGFPIKIAHYLAYKYGYQAEDAPLYETEIVRLLTVLTARLECNALAQKQQVQEGIGPSYYFGDTLTALDIYSATFMAYFAPLPDDVCAMHPRMRLTLETCSPATAAVLDPILLQHRDFIYKKYLELPLSL